jgi:hypothetical protein
VLKISTRGAIVGGIQLDTIIILIRAVIREVQGVDKSHSSKRNRLRIPSRKNHQFKNYLMAIQ